MDQKFDFEPINKAPLVYIRAVSMDDLPEDIRAMTGGVSTV